MNRLSELLRTAVDADGEPDHLDLDVLHARAGTRRRRRTQVRLAGGVVGALALVAGLAAAVGAGADSPGEVRAEAPEDPGVGEPPEPSTEPSTTAAETTTVPDPTTTSTTEPAPSSTTSTMPAPTTAPPPTTTAPAPRIVELTWDYAGLEQYRLSQPQCPQLTHWLDAEAVASDGSAWSLREDYCGEHLGDRWEGSGTFALSSADATLQGRMTSVAPMPTDGVPYSYAIEEGTGTLAGATGACTVTIVMTDKAFGSAHHEGTITCTATLGGDGGAGGEAPEGSVPESV